MRVHSIAYGGFIKAQAAPVPAAVSCSVDEEQQPPDAADPTFSPAVAAPSASIVDEAAPVKTEADNQRSKNNAAAAQKPKIGGAAASKGGPQKRNK